MYTNFNISLIKQLSLRRLFYHIKRIRVIECIMCWVWGVLVVCDKAWKWGRRWRGNTNIFILKETLVMLKRNVYVSKIIRFDYHRAKLGGRRALFSQRINAFLRFYFTRRLDGLRVTLNFPPLLNAVHHVLSPEAMRLVDAHLNKAKANFERALDFLQLLVQPTVVATQFSYLSERHRSSFLVLLLPLLHLLIVVAVVAVQQT